MEKIIAAHLPDLETWQSSCLLFDEISFAIEDDIMTVLNNVVYNKIKKWNVIINMKMKV